MSFDESFVVSRNVVKNLIVFSKTFFAARGSRAGFAMPNPFMEMFNSFIVKGFRQRANGIAILIGLILCSPFYLYAIDGPPTPTAGVSYVYSLTDDAFFPNPTWTASGG